MENEVSVIIAGILGPILMVVASSELLNFKIWRNVDVTVVALNGLVLLICGIVIIRFHNIWYLDWRLIITLLGWVMFLLAIYRSFFPKAQQAKENRLTHLFLIFLFLLGCFLTYKGYID